MFTVTYVFVIRKTPYCTCCRLLVGKFERTLRLQHVMFSTFRVQCNAVVCQLQSNLYIFSFDYESNNLKGRSVFRLSRYSDVAIRFFRSYRGFDGQHGRRDIFVFTNFQVGRAISVSTLHRFSPFMAGNRIHYIRFLEKNQFSLFIFSTQILFLRTRHSRRQLRTRGIHIDNRTRSSVIVVWIIWFVVASSRGYRSLSALSGYRFRACRIYVRFYFENNLSSGANTVVCVLEVASNAKNMYRGSQFNGHRYRKSRVPIVYFW